MSKIDELISQLCPDGVEYKKLREIGTVTRGGNFQKKHFVDQGIPCIHYGQIYTRYGLHATEAISFVSSETASKSKMAHPGDVVMAVTSENIEDVCKCVTWLGNCDAAISGHTAIIHHNQNPKYMTYFFHSAIFDVQKRKLARGTKVIEVTPDKLLDVVIPVPPIEIQEEIVRVLDSFAELEAELEAELGAELGARQRQYAYYRNRLLDFSADATVKWYRLSDLYTQFISPIRDRPKVFDGDVPWCRIEDVEGHYMNDSREGLRVTQDIIKRMNLKVYPVGTVLVACSASIGTCAITTRPLVSNQRFVGLVCGDKIRNTFLRYYIESRTEDLASISSTGTIAGITRKRLDGLMVPVPSLEEQDRIVAILDRFDELFNDITKSLPAEIEARRKQYAYHRDKLLTFKEKVA